MEKLWTHFDTLIVQLKAECDSSTKYVHDFGSISFHNACDCGACLALSPASAFIPFCDHPTFLVHDSGVDNTILDSLANNVFCVFFRIKVELEADVPERDAGVGEGQLADAGLDDVLSEAGNQSQGAVCCETGTPSRDGCLKLVKGASTYSCCKVYFSRCKRRPADCTDPERCPSKAAEASRERDA